MIRSILCAVILSVSSSATFACGGGHHQPCCLPGDTECMRLNRATLGDEEAEALVTTLTAMGEPTFQVLLNLGGQKQAVRCCGGHHMPRECPCPE